MSDAVSRAAPPTNPLRAYAAVTAAYWAFMLSDGALRMLVLLHFNTLGFTPLQLAWLFLLYEVAGIVTNLAAGLSDNEPSHEEVARIGAEASGRIQELLTQLIPRL